MALRKTPIVIGVLAAAVVSAGTAYAMATTSPSSGPHPDTVAVADVTAGSANTIYLEADLNGGNERTMANRSAMGDPHGTAVELLRIKGNQVAFEITWHNLGTPTIAQMHSGAAGMSGAPVMPMVTAPMSDTVTAVAGQVTVNSAKMLARLVSNPNQFYLNVGTAKYPGGAVRGQFRRIGPVDFERILHVGPFAALNSGGQEVSTGDNDARATAFIGLGTTSINYAVSWTGLNSPTSFAIDRGAVGMNGEPVAKLFVAPHGIAPAITEVAGVTMNVPARTIAAIKANPAMFYTNLTTARFPLGAVRGQLFLVPPSMTTTTTMPTTTPMKPTTTMPTMPTTQPSMSSQPMQPTTTPSASTPAPPHW
jgi:hypothetical protein